MQSCWSSAQFFFSWLWNMRRLLQQLSNSDYISDFRSFWIWEFVIDLVLFLHQELSAALGEQLSAEDEEAVMAEYDELEELVSESAILLTFKLKYYHVVQDKLSTDSFCFFVDGYWGYAGRSYSCNSTSQGRRDCSTSEPIEEPIAELAEAPTKQVSKKVSFRDPEADDEEDDEVLDLPTVPTSPVRRKEAKAASKEKRKGKPLSYLVSIWNHHTNIVTKTFYQLQKWALNGIRSVLSKVFSKVQFGVCDCELLIGSQCYDDIVYHGVLMNTVACCRGTTSSVTPHHSSQGGLWYGKQKTRGSCWIHTWRIPQYKNHILMLKNSNQVSCLPPPEMVWESADSRLSPFTNELVLSASFLVYIMCTRYVVIIVISMMHCNCSATSSVW